MSSFRERILSELPTECWVSRSDLVFCIDFIGGEFQNGAIWQREMCCLPCRIRDTANPAPEETA